MIKYYTRACNFKYGSIAKTLIKKRLALPLCGNKNISFDQIEIISRNKNKISTKLIHFKKLNNLNYYQKKKSKKRLKKYCLQKKKFFKKY